MANVYVRSGAIGAANGSSWTDAYTTLAAALTAKAAGDSFWVSEDHAETAASVKTLTSPGTAANPCFIYCVDHAGSVPPVSADLRTTATITTTGTNSINLDTGHTYVYGIIFSCGTSTGNPSITIGSGLGAGVCMWILDRCRLDLIATGASSIIMGSAFQGQCTKITLKNTAMTFSATAHAISIRYASFSWKDTASAILGAALPTTLFTETAGTGLVSSDVTTLEGVDLSALGSGKTLVADTNATKKFIFKDCKFGASVTVAATPTGPVRCETYVVRSDSSGTNYRNEKYQYMGTQVAETTIIRTGGASDGTTGLSWKLTTTANSKWVLPFEALPIAIWSSTTGANVTATIEGLWNSATLPNNDDVWFDLEYLGASGNPQGSFKSGTKADNLATGSALTSSTQAWDSLATAWASLHAYSVGDVIKSTNNAGRIFFCTTAGTTGVTEAAGFATAVDGGSVTDVTAVFRAATRFKLAVTATSPQPAQAGTMYLYPKAAKASSTFWIDPLATLS